MTYPSKFSKIFQSVMASVLLAAGITLAVAPAQASFNPLNFLASRGLLNFSPYISQTYSAINRGPLASSPTTTLSTLANSVAQNASGAVVYINAYKQMPTYNTEYFRVGRRIIATRAQSGTAERQISSGSGFFVSSNGYILTNKHVVDDASASYKVSLDDGTIKEANIVYRDTDNDIAIVKIDGQDYPTLSLGDSSSLAVGQNIVAVGNALGALTDFATEGKIMSLSQNIEISGEDGSSENLSGVVKISARLYPGDSGGPLLNLEGQAIGINTATSVGGRKNASGFSIPINDAKQTLHEADIKI